MIEEGRAYISNEPEGENKEVVRFKNPNKKIVFKDLIRGDIEFDTTELKDFVIARNIDDPLYHLTVVVDDFEMGVTHIIRGEDGISNTPRQILIQEAIGAPRPTYAHIPLILAADKSKLSGRHGAVSIREYRDMGYLPEALVNYLALLGWHPQDNEEVFTLESLVKVFDLEKVQKGGAIFDEKKLKWVNKEHIKKLPQDKLFEKVKSLLGKEDSPENDVTIKKVMVLLTERIETWGDLVKLIADGEAEYFFTIPKLDETKISWKDDTVQNAKECLKDISKIIETIPEENFDTETFKEYVWKYAEEKGRGKVLWPLRYSLSGRDKSPDPFTLAGILGKTETLKRIAGALG
jgi:glutamyl-tRNA synthetase